MYLRVITRNGRCLYPFHRMTPGDHFTVPARFGKRAASAAYMFSTRHGQRFSCREYGNKGRVRVTAVRG